MIQLSDLDALLKANKSATIEVLDLKKNHKTGARSLLNGTPRPLSVKVARAIMFYTNPRSSKYGERKEDRQSSSFMFYADYAENQGTPIASTPIINIDRNSLSDAELFKNPEVVEAMKEAGVFPVATEMTEEEMIAKLQASGRISGNGKVKNQGNDLDNA